MFYCNCSDEFNDDSDAGSISLDEDGSDIFESDDENAAISDDSDEDPDAISDPEDEQPKAKRMKTVSSKDFQRKLKNTTSKLFFAVTNTFCPTILILTILSLHQI